MNSGQVIEVVEINLFYAKAELRQMTDPSAPARALLHIEEALKELRDVQGAVVAELRKPTNN